ncbi:hypothetical protein [Rhizobium metallidurans]|uniref:Transmembrane anchored protein n=1 Tax=Rhizobium metallidurans TaxID=1265931 RepID=A0A7W6CY14_9HYPH|nr:hypothetical protein [Rhizobium metallidurans]MBB3964566.1 hypothetical protein [Rhizobium metallidurans]
MRQALQSSTEVEESPLLSTGFLIRTTIIIALLAALTVAISIGGRWFGARVSLAGNTDSTAQVTLTIGQDTLQLQENTIRFPSQRHGGSADRADLYLTWPQMQGYSSENRDRFDDTAKSSDLIFLQVTQATMSRDMSGRFEPIYSHLVDPTPQPYANGMTLRRFRADSGYGEEVLLTAPRQGRPDYVVRCLLPATPELSTSGDCQRDIRVGRDLSVLYRFSSRQLAQWEHIDAAIAQFVETRLVNRSVTSR